MRSARHLGELGEIRITRTEPEKRVEWEADGTSGTIVIKPSGWGTKVTLSVTRELSAPEAEQESVAEGEPAADVKPIAAAPSRRRPRRLRASQPPTAAPAAAVARRSPLRWAAAGSSHGSSAVARRRSRSRLRRSPSRRPPEPRRRLHKLRTRRRRPDEHTGSAIEPLQARSQPAVVEPPERRRATQHARSRFDGSSEQPAAEPAAETTADQRRSLQRLKRSQSRQASRGADRRCSIASARRTTGRSRAPSRGRTSRSRSSRSDEPAARACSPPSDASARARRADAPRPRRAGRPNSEPARRSMAAWARLASDVARPASTAAPSSPTGRVAATAAEHGLAEGSTPDGGLTALIARSARSR